MDIECAVWSNLECTRRQDQPVCRDYQSFWPWRSETAESPLVIQGPWLKDFQAAGGG